MRRDRVQFYVLELSVIAVASHPTAYGWSVTPLSPTLLQTTDPEEGVPELATEFACSGRE